MLGRDEMKRTYKLFFLLFFITTTPAQSCVDTFTLEDFQIIYESSDSDADFTQSEKFTKEQRLFFMSLYEQGNLIKLIQHYHTLATNGDQSKENLNKTIQSTKKLIHQLLLAGVIDRSYKILNKIPVDKVVHCLELLNQYLNNQINRSTLLTDPLITSNILHSFFIDETGTTGLMLASKMHRNSTAQCQKLNNNDFKKIFIPLLEGYLAQVCPLDAQNIYGETIYSFMSEELLQRYINKINKKNEPNIYCIPGECRPL